MDSPARVRWLPVVLLLGAVYLLAGLAFGALAGNAPTHQMQVAWRLAAWVVSAIAFASHIAFEQIRRHSSPRTAACRASLAAALGAFGLAVAANVHAFTIGSHHRSHTLALVLWPLATALPAFGVALLAAAGLAFARRAD